MILQSLSDDGILVALLLVVLAIGIFCGAGVGLWYGLQQCGV
jgi:hypothetical protein